MTHTPNLGLPYLQPAQALKYITYNEALLMLDRITQLNAIAQISEPPNDSQIGDRYIVGEAPTLAWVGFSGYIAELIAADQWHLLKPERGWVCNVIDDKQLYHYSDDQWRPLLAPLTSAAFFGVNAQADELNRLLVKSSTALFDHDGQSHILKINKSSAQDTASLQFQTAYTSHAEIGLTGSDDLTVKVSPDSTGWKKALTIETDTANTKCRNIYSGEFYLLNNTARTITPPKTGGFLMIMIDDPAYPQLSHSAIVSYDVGASPNVLMLSGGPNVQVVKNEVLTGTFGDEQFTTLSALAGELMIENRYGTHQTYRYTFLG